jgi:1-acyl-sn-glycerol-3-phosphate acyltransferase
MNVKYFQDPPFGLLALFQMGRGTVFFVALFSVLLVINAVQISSLLILPFSRNFFRKINRFCAFSWWGICVLTAKHMNGTRIVVSGDAIPVEENAVVFANHQQMSDIFIIMIFSIPMRRLGDLKWFVKDVLKYIPGVGWGMLFLDCIFVKRNWEADRNLIESMFSKFKRDKIPVWLISFVEGTRIKDAKVTRSQQYARENGLPVLERVLIPRTKGFVATVQGLSEYVPAVYDITIGYPQGMASLWQIAKGTASEFHVHVKRFPIEALPRPQDNLGLASWLIQRFVEKDRLLDEFYRQGHF